MTDRPCTLVRWRAKGRIRLAQTPSPAPKDALRVEEGRVDRRVRVSVETKVCAHCACDASREAAGVARARVDSNSAPRSRPAPAPSQRRPDSQWERRDGRVTHTPTGAGGVRLAMRCAPVSRLVSSSSGPTVHQSGATCTSPIASNPRGDEWKGRTSKGSGWDMSMAFHPPLLYCLAPRPRVTPALLRRAQSRADQFLFTRRRPQELRRSRTIRLTPLSLSPAVVYIRRCVQSLKRPPPRLPEPNRSRSRSCLRLARRLQSHR